MAKELPKIKPCPFCKHDAKLMRITYLPNKARADEFAVECQWESCEVQGPVRLSGDIAIEAWNRAPRGANEP